MNTKKSNKIIKKLVFYVLFVILYTHTSYSQTKGDSLKLIWKNDKNTDTIRFKALNNYYTAYHFSKLDSTLAVTDYHYKLAQEKGSTYQMIWALNNKANTYRVNGKELDSAMLLYNKAEKLAKKINNISLTAIILGDKGNIYLEEKKYLEAIQHYAQAQKLFQEHKDEIDEARMFNNLAGIYFRIGSYDLALKNYNKSLAIFSKSKSEDRRIALLNLNIGLIYKEQKKYDEALMFYKKALQIVEAKQDSYFIAACHSELATAYLEDKQFDKANYHINKSLKISNDNNYNRLIADSNLIKAEITYETNVEEAQIQAEAILAKLDKNSSKDYKKDLYELLYKCYKSQNKIDASLKMYELSTIYADSIQVEKNSFAIAREAVKNDYEQKLYETKIENEAKQEELKQKQSNKTKIIILASTLLIVLILLYVRSNNIKNKKEIAILLEEIESLKKAGNPNLIANANKFELNREKIENSINRKLNETDWKVLTIMLDDPVIPNKEIAEKAFMSVDGIGSSLRRMYEYFEVKESKYKKISLIMDAIKVSNN